MALTMPMRHPSTASDFAPPVGPASPSMSISSHRPRALMNLNTAKVATNEPPVQGIRPTVPAASFDGDGDGEGDGGDGAGVGEGDGGDGAGV